MYGLPGAGKTTISIPVILKLKEKGYKVADLTDVYFRNCNKRSKFKVIIELLLTKNSYILFFSIALYCLKFSQESGNLKFLFKLLFLVHQIIKTLDEGKYDLVLCEEGIIQYMTSLFFMSRMHDNELLRKIMSRITTKIHILAINCDIEIEESFKRISKRGETSRRYSSKTSSPILISALKMKRKNLSIIAKYVPVVYKIQMKQDVDNNKKDLYNLLLTEIQQSEI